MVIAAQRGLTYVPSHNDSYPDALVYFQDSNDKEAKGEFHFSKVQTVKRCEKVLTDFRLVMTLDYKSPGRVYHLRAKSVTDCGIWIDAIQIAKMDFMDLGAWTDRSPRKTQAAMQTFATAHFCVLHECKPPSPLMAIDSNRNGCESQL